MKNKINLLVMPTDCCNMNCVYCFHSSFHEKEGRMSGETLRRLYDITFACYQNVLIIWHGGEPLCMGKSFFEEALQLQTSYPGVHVINRMQSNLTLLTDDMADFLCSSHIGGGSSFDGINNEYLRGDSERILAGREKLLSRGKACGFIMVLSRKNVDTLIESYELFKRLNANYSINPYVHTTAVNDSELALDASHTIQRLQEFFDYWIADAKCNVHVDYFERILKFIIFGKKSVCKYTSCLGKWLGIRYDGSIVPCNRYFPDEFGLGSIWDYDKLSDAFQSDGFRRLLEGAIERRYKCQNCEVFPFCAGGCNNVALNEGGITENGGSTCKITKGIYSYIKTYLSDSEDHRLADRQANPMIRRLISNKGY